jgi:hypothetical protein
MDGAKRKEEAHGERIEVRSGSKEFDFGRS